MTAAPSGTAQTITLRPMLVDGFDAAAAFAAAVRATGTPVGAEQLRKRLDKIRGLIEVFMRRMDAVGPHRPPAILEAGVWRGLSAHVLAQAVRHRHPGWTGAGLHLVDGFQGLAEPSEEDLVDRPDHTRRATVHASNFESSPDVVRRALAGFPDIGVHAGWIPHILSELPDRRWDFVHLDIDHYAPTRDSLAYLIPRMAKGGAIVDDDYGSELFPGPRRAWDDAIGRHGLRIERLPTGQAVMVAG